MRQHNFQQVIIGLGYMYDNALLLGVRYRSRDSFIGLLGLRYHTFQVTFSYDRTISRLSSASGGSYEFGVSYRFARKNKGVRFDTIF